MEDSIPECISNYVYILFWTKSIFKWTKYFDNFAKKDIQIGYKHLKKNA